MTVPELLRAVYDSGAASWMRGTVRAMPLVEGLHLLSMAAAFGTILIVDLRLLGLPDARRPFTRVAHDVLPWTWAAFAVCGVTGALMFAPNAFTYARNAAFLLKMGALGVAGLNMAAFQLIATRSITRWDRDAPAPPLARAAAAMSILLWIAMILLGRWTGFTKGYDFSIPDDVHPQFDFPE